ncbi:MAG: RDD family protein [Candidatus Hodarchaeales archaeon]
MAGWIRIITGSILFLISLGLVIGGGAIFIITPIFTDSDGYINSPSEIIEESAGQAIVLFSDNWDFKSSSTGPFSDKWTFDTSSIFKLRVIVNNLETNEEYMIYYGEAEASRAFLANISYHEIIDTDFKFGEGTLDITTVLVQNTTTGNTVVPTWYQETEGPIMDIASFHAGEFAIILMSPSSSSGINCQIQVGVNIPFLNVVATALLVFGGLLMMLAIFLIVWGATAKPKPHDMPLDRVRYYKAQESAVRESEGKKILVCAVCGRESPEDSKFCFECGEPLYSIQEPEIGVKKAVAPTTDMVVADGWPRFWAWVIDIVIVGFVIETIKWPFYLLNPGHFSFFMFGATFSINSLACFVYWTLMEYYYGQSIGKMILGLEIVSETGDKLKLVDTAVSAAGKSFFLPFDIIISWFISNEEKKKIYGADLKQRVSQMLAKTVVIRKRYAFPGEGEKSSFIPPRY